MIISIASGKGGTGKTTIATNLAVALAPDVKLLDCDVEEPNDHIFIRPEITHTERVSLKVPQVDMSKCSLCGRCQEICQFQAIVVVGKTALTFHELCHSCGGCVEVSPEDAIDFPIKTCGELFISSQEVVCSCSFRPSFRSVLLAYS